MGKVGSEHPAINNEVAKGLPIEGEIKHNLPLIQVFFETR
jgi:hypothetical protein